MKQQRGLSFSLAFALAVSLGMFASIRSTAHADALGLATGNYVLYLDSALDADTSPNYTGYISIGNGVVSAFQLAIPPADWSYNIPSILNDSIIKNSVALFAIQDTEDPGNTGSILAQLDWSNAWFYGNPTSRVADWGTWTAQVYSGSYTGPLARVSEPSSFFLLLTGLFGYLLFRSRRTQDFPQ
jgi:hypothetical protein